MSQKALLIITDGDIVVAVQVIPTGMVLRNFKEKTIVENGIKKIISYARTDIPFIVKKDDEGNSSVLAQGTKSSDMWPAIQQLVADAKTNK